MLTCMQQKLQTLKSKFKHPDELGTRTKKMKLGCIPKTQNCLASPCEAKARAFLYIVDVPAATCVPIFDCVSSPGCHISVSKHARTMYTSGKKDADEFCV